MRSDSTEFVRLTPYFTDHLVHQSGNAIRRVVSNEFPEGTAVNFAPRTLESFAERLRFGKYIIRD